MKLIGATVVGIAALVGSVSANAVLVDFTNPDAWTFTSDTAAVSSTSVGQVTVNAAGGHLTLENPLDDCVSANGAVFGGRLACNADGAGVRRSGWFGVFGDLIAHTDDEVGFSPKEKLTVSFEGGPRGVTEILLLDLFPDQHCWLCGNYDERGVVSWDGGLLGFSAQDASGGLLLRFDTPIWTQSLTFAAKKGSYALAGMSVVPLPAAAWLFGTALMGLAAMFGLRRRAV